MLIWFLFRVLWVHSSINLRYQPFSERKPNPLQFGVSIKQEKHKLKLIFRGERNGGNVKLLFAFHAELEHWMKEERINNLCLETAKQKHQLYSIRFNFFKKKTKNVDKLLFKICALGTSEKRTFKSFYILCDQKQCFFEILPSNESLLATFTEFQLCASLQTLTFFLLI